MAFQDTYSLSSSSSFEGVTFIVDNICTAYVVAIIAKKCPIHCIYECKEISWRNAHYVELFDFILSDVTFLSKVVLSVPHPFLSPSKNLFKRILREFYFVRSLRKRYPLDPSRTYVSSTVSSLLIANKRYISYILIDEGMSSVVARHLRSFRGNRLLDRFKNFIAERILSFHFPMITPQITMTNDSHRSVLMNIDYRDFDSNAFEASLSKLSALMNSDQCNVLVLLKGPTFGNSGHIDETEPLSDSYIDFNICGILAYLEQLSEDLSPIFFLKSHPSLGCSRGKLNKLIYALESKGIIAYDALNYIDFQEASSLPAEGLLRYLPIEHVLALDVSSLLWNVSYRDQVLCFLPLNYVIEFAEAEGCIHSELYSLQERLNKLMGGSVRFFDVKDSSFYLQNLE